MARNVNHTGKFFGEFQGDVMEAMVQLEYYQSIDVYDYQSLCVDEDAKQSEGNALMHVSILYYNHEISITNEILILKQPWKVLTLAWKWLVTTLFWHYSRIQWWVEGSPCKYFFSLNSLKKL